ncbi:AraC family transcriptional regulator [Aureimonas sp. SK2]|uniref:AraC family transcriptional regulator n=1 Tax=Aureimonas sp. SK2 TaxID=3015992 RepID=UPI0024446422|nr:AraC family transcriptional regulator [Aureimonas sp. SK2]
MQRIDLNELPTRERFDAWTVLTDPFFMVSRQRKSDFHCRMSTAQWDDTLLVETEVSEQRYEHTVRHARSGGWDQIVFQMYRRGAFRGIYGDTEVKAGAGDIILIDFSQPFAKESTDEVDLNLVVPREIVQQRLPYAQHGAVLNHGAPLARLANIHLEGLRVCMDRLEPLQAHGAIDAFLTLLSGAGFAEIAPTALPFVRATARRCAEDYVRRHLHDTGLDIAAIVRHCGISRATLYRLFEQDGGIQAFIRNERLSVAWRLVRECPSAKMQEIADSCGFNDAAGFSRAFRQAFDATPSEVRGAGRTAEGTGFKTPDEWIETVRRFQSEA